jgi:hypothetical protein
MWRTARLWSQTYVAMATRGAPMGYSRPDQLDTREKNRGILDAARIYGI